MIIRRDKEKTPVKFQDVSTGTVMTIINDSSYDVLFFNKIFIKTDEEQIVDLDTGINYGNLPKDCLCIIYPNAELVLN